jgi:multiple sugar transport system permease protein
MISQKRSLLRTKRFILTGIVVLSLLAFLVPLFYGMAMSVKDEDQISSQKSLILPKSPATFAYEGKQLEVFEVPMPSGEAKQLAALDKTRTATTFIDPADSKAAPIVWQGNWRTLKQVLKLDAKWVNFEKAWNAIQFPMLLKNTVIYAVVNTFGILLSSSFVAYGFSRFKFRGKNFAFMMVMSTMILPGAITLIPTYAVFMAIGWVGTWLPLLVPAFFSNAYNVFLLRQFFMGIPQEMDEAARIDGANPIQILYKIILPQAVPALVAAGLFNFFWCWNDYFAPLVYLSGKTKLYPVALGLGQFAGQYTVHVNMVQAATLQALVIPVTIFFFTQRFFMQGVVVSGVEK